ncbi:chromosome loss- protein [Neophaeococcomyces mojaviensis]|uniref:Chromosome loss- protein n=1 Tax=Neophaeococcomyces mojaviensis TaxID=3383035 RepID=A0ACC2ZV90_9EURO|nr:chromosome loss- protein [Knufia sp. JES_112]
MPSAVAKSLSRLSRDKLIDLCVSWSKSAQCDPYLTTNRNLIEADEEDYLHEPAESRDDLKNLYTTFKQNGSFADLENVSKKDIVDRIVDGDWRRGLSYSQLASIDFAALEENDTNLRWSALKLVPLTRNSDEQAIQRPSKRRKTGHTTSKTIPQHYPQITAAEFVQQLKAHISPLVKAHYHLHRISALNLSVVRLCIVPNTPFAPLSTNIPRNGKAALDSARIMYIALPDSCPYVYVSISGASTPNRQSTRKTGPKATSSKVDVTATKRIVLEAIPKALSRPQQRWALQSTELTAKSLRGMTLLRGNGKVGVTGGAFSRLEAPPQKASGGNSSYNEAVFSAANLRDIEGLTEHEKLVERRFGDMAATNRANLDRVQVRVHSLFHQPNVPKKKRKHIDHDMSPADEPMPMMITFSGTDVFGGLKELAMKHPTLVDLGKLPRHLTGEAGTSTITL